MTRRTIWLASYPKSGNTWFRAVTVALIRQGPVDLNRLRAPGIGSIASSRVRMEAALGVPSSLMTHEEVDLLRPRVEEVVAQTAPARVRPDDPEAAATEADAAGSRAQITKIHDALFPGPSGEPIVSVAATRSAIYIVRDPRDVAVSYAHYSGWSPERAVDALADPDYTMSSGTRRVHDQVRQRLGTWSDHVCSWLDHDFFPVHVVRYEDCARAPVETFTTALRFAGYDVEPADVAEAVDTVRFDRLATQERTAGFRERPASADRFFRRGEAGAWREELAPELAARIEATHGHVMRRLGYPVGPDAAESA